MISRDNTIRDGATSDIGDGRARRPLGASILEQPFANVTSHSKWETGDSSEGEFLPQ